MVDNFNAVKGLLKLNNINLEKLVKEISGIINCEIFLISENGEVLACQSSLFPASETQRKPELKPEFKQRLSFVFETTLNLPVDSCFLNEPNLSLPYQFMTLIPIRKTQGTSGHMIFAQKRQLTTDELILAETAALVVCIYMYEQNLKTDLADRQSFNALQVLNSLSFSEIKAIRNVFEVLNGMEGFLIASKVADRIGISRSVIVNAMRKLESAGVVESRSLGIKGTYIKIKDQQFLGALFERFNS